jgi:hypothetical protein
MKKRDFLARGAAAAGACALMPAWLLALPGAAQAQSPLQVELDDLSGRFLRFHQAAQMTAADAARRVALWREFKVPTVVPLDDAALGERLDRAYERYAAVLPQIEKGYAGISPPPSDMLGRMFGLLKMPQLGPIKMTFLAYVGFFDRPAEVLQREAELTLALPLEQPAARQGVQAALALARHLAGKAGIDPANARSVAERIYLEGLLLNLVAVGLPKLGEDDIADAYVGEDGWFAKLQARQGEIFRAIRPLLADTKPASIERVGAQGNGPAGFKAEAAYIGFFAVSRWLGRSLTYTELLRTPPAEMPKNLIAVMDSFGRR